MRRLAAVALLVLLAACGDGSAGSDAVRESAGQVSTEATTTSTVAADTTTTAAAAAGPTTTAAPGARTTTTRARATTTTARAAAATTTSTAPAGARPLTPAAPGTYRFDTAGATTFGASTIPFPGVTTLVVDPPSGTTQRSTRDMMDAAGNGLRTEFVFDYRPAGVYLVSLKFTVGLAGVTEVRDLRPATPRLLLATGEGPGARREANLTGTSPARLTLDLLREERVTVAGQAVDTLAIKAVVTLPPGDISGRLEMTLNLDRGSRLWVRESAVADATAGGGLFSAHSEATSNLQRLTPF